MRWIALVVLAGCAARQTSAAGGGAGSGGGGGGATQAAAATARTSPAGHVLERVPVQVWSVLPGKITTLLLAPGADGAIPIVWTRYLPLQGAKLPTRAVYYAYGDGESARALYFESLDGSGENFLRNWSVPLADGTAARYDAAMLGPGMANRFGLSEDAHIVELEVNGGRGAAAGLHFVATAATILDGTAAAPLHPAQVMADARTRWQAHVLASGTAIEAALAEAARAPVGESLGGAETTTVYEGFYPSWRNAERRLTVLWVRHEVRTTTRTEMRRVVSHCPRGAPCRPPQDVTVTIVHGYAIELGEELTYDAHGALLATEDFTPAPLTAAQVTGFGYVALR